jgi:hypothetical protein
MVRLKGFREPPKAQCGAAESGNHPDVTPPASRTWMVKPLSEEAVF